jgi:excisionase family DNA binding protein
MKNSSKHHPGTTVLSSMEASLRPGRGARRYDPEHASQERIPERHYTVSEVAEIYRVTSRTVRNWIKDKKLRALRKGRILRIPHSALGEFDESH